MNFIIKQKWKKGSYLGSSGVVSEVVNGKRSIKTHIPHLQLSHRKGTDTFST